MTYSGHPSELRVPSIADLRLHFEHENQEWKNGKPWLQSRVRQAYCDWFRASVKAGSPPDALVRKIEDETERFHTSVIAGVDGHSYWDGSQTGFLRNDGKRRNPRTWWYEATHEPIEVRAVVKPVCGDPHCIAPEHQSVTLWSELKMRYTDAQCTGAIQVAAMRLGHTPTGREYQRMKLKPSHHAIQIRFSSWSRAVEAAGLVPNQSSTMFGRQWSDADCLGALKEWSRQHGHAPSGNQWVKAGMLPSEHTIRRRFGGWRAALAKAGLA